MRKGKEGGAARIGVLVGSREALEKGEGERSTLLGDSGIVLRRSIEGRTGNTHPHLI